jgi:uncharacterized protein (DUF924 family)
MKQSITPLPEAAAVLQFWLQDALVLGWPSKPLTRLWWGGGTTQDNTVDVRFGPLVREAVKGGLAQWESNALDRLALVLLLDQLTRNVFRGQSHAFAGDARAQALVTNALTLAWDEKLPLAGRAFFYLPLTHSEDMVLQDQGVQHFELLLRDAPPGRARELQSFLKSARQHRDIIAAFGRFPHRNAALGRNSSAREQDFLQHGPRFGQ